MCVRSCGEGNSSIIITDTIAITVGGTPLEEVEDEPPPLPPRDSFGESSREQDARKRKGSTYCPHVMSFQSSKKDKRKIQWQPFSGSSGKKKDPLTGASLYCS